MLMGISNRLIDWLNEKNAEVVSSENEGNIINDKNKRLIWKLLPQRCYQWESVTRFFYKHAVYKHARLQIAHILSTS